MLPNLSICFTNSTCWQEHKWKSNYFCSEKKWLLSKMKGFIIFILNISKKIQPFGGRLCYVSQQPLHLTVLRWLWIQEGKRCALKIPHRKPCFWPVFHQFNRWGSTPLILDVCSVYLHLFPHRHFKGMSYLIWVRYLPEDEMIHHLRVPFSPKGLQEWREVTSLAGQPSL